MKLNCDLGESFGVWRMGLDEAVMPLIDMANIACGFHASDPVNMHKTLKLAHQHGVTVGAHPGYPDLQGFGRRSMQCTEEELKSMIWYQVAALEGMARVVGVQVSYIKPHGAMSHDMMRDPIILSWIMQAVQAYGANLRLMIPVSLAYEQHRQMAADIGTELLFEAFADRAYDADGYLVPRAQSGAVLQESSAIVEQARSFAHAGGVRSISGEWLALPVDSLCVHGDNAQSVQAVAAIREALVSAP